jgi:hypothetical protein
MFGLEAKALTALAVVAALIFALKMHDRGIRQQCEADHKAAAMAEFQRNAQAIGDIANESQRLQNRSAADRASLAAAAVRLRGTVSGSGLVIRSAAAAASSPMSETERLSGQLLDSCAAIAGWAECLATSGDTCVKSYNALTR